MARVIDRVSIELSQRCSKGCDFCYSHSRPEGDPGWPLATVVDFVQDLAAAGVRFVSFGGGEPLEYQGLPAILAATRGRVGRAITTNGLALEAALPALVDHAVEKVHISVHDPARLPEVRRALDGVSRLSAAGIAAGVNLLVARSRLAEARDAWRAMRANGLRPDQIVLLPRRGGDTPTAAEVASVADGPFQSMSCLQTCGPSPRFASIGWDRTVAWCSYTRTRRVLRAPTYAAVVEALDGLALAPCAAGMRTP